MVVVRLSSCASILVDTSTCSIVVELSVGTEHGEDHEQHLQSAHEKHMHVLCKMSGRSRVSTKQQQQQPCCVAAAAAAAPLLRAHAVGAAAAAAVASSSRERHARAPARCAFVHLRQRSSVLFWWMYVCNGQTARTRMLQRVGGLGAGLPTLSKCLPHASAAGDAHAWPTR